ncbi:late secretory pathway protein AVL9 homolog isoform X2 [Tubulanus polymorphus]|uniref:late secretory pathway protein AVL9 homolog isoform X2 n=1 Tax=Tubulanus polymorphus TaxID=672921 RepID=UPI003DA34BCA
MSSAGMDKCVLHVCVVGFHHKKGCQLEFAYPPLIEGNSVDSHELPDVWKHLPSLALPDGAHNYEKDTIYFHLKSRDDSSNTVFGVSCYRQISAQDLINKTADITRSTVQKSVCVLSTLPLYGLIQAKLELITHAYFEERDFSQVALLEAMYTNLNAQITANHIKSQAFLGMSARDVVIKYRHKVLILFKLLLLERKVLFFMSPVSTLNNAMLAILSLFPGMIENGLTEAAGTITRKVSATLRVDSFGADFIDVSYLHEDDDLDPHDDKPDIIKSHQPKLMLEMPSSRTTANNSDNSGNSPRVTPSSGGGTPRSSDHVFFSSSHDCPGKAVQVASPGGSAAEAITTQPGIAPVPSLPCVHTAALHPEKIGYQGNEQCSHCRRASSSQNDDERASVKFEIVADDSFKKSEGNSTFYARNSTDAARADVEPFVFSDVVNSDDEITFKQAIARDSFLEKSTPALTVNITSPGGTIGKPEYTDLDSPESLYEIDREDNFLWEDDKLLLEIEAELEDDGKAKQTSTSPELILDLKGEIDAPPSVSLDEPNEQTESGQTTTTAGFIRGKLNLVETDETAIHVAPPTATDVIRNMTPPVSPVRLQQDGHGFPLAIFTKGSVCHPYLPLQYFNILEDVNIRSFVIGATNILFKQRRHLTDVVIGEGATNFEFHDPELRKALTLTTADLRFADYLVKNVLGENLEDLYLDGTGWEGGEEWIRVQFKVYLTSLIATVEYSGDEKLCDEFNTNFVRAWKTTHNYRVWKSGQQKHGDISEMDCGHPCRGQIGIGDMKLRIQHSMQSTEKGRKIMQSTEQVVNKTGKAVESAFSQAKSTFSGWFNYLKPQQQQETLDEADE